MILSDIYNLTVECGHNIAIAPIPFLWPIFTVVVTAIAGTSLYWLTKKTNLKGKSIAILGMQEAGKTRLLRILQNKPYIEEATSTEDYSGFVAKIGSKQVKIQGGRDIGGGDLYIRDYYEKYIQEKDIVFFLFDVKRYIDNYAYSQQVRARLDYIYRKLHQKYSDPKDLNAHYVVFATHVDQLSKSNKKSMIKLLQSTVANKDYSVLFHNNLYAVDLTKKEDVIKNLEKVF